jgi:hypothetical protein
MHIEKNTSLHNQMRKQKSPKPKKQPKTQTKHVATYTTHNHHKTKE